MKGKLRWQLMLSYLPFILTPILIIGIITRGAAEHGLGVWGTQQAEQHAQNIAGRFSDYYAAHNGWGGVDTLLSTIQKGDRHPDPSKADHKAPPPNDKPPPLGAEQILLADTHGVVIASDDTDTLGQTLSPEALSHGAPISVNGQTVGTVVIGAALGILDQQQKQLLDTVNMALLLSGAISAVLTVIIGLWVSTRLTTPIKQLMQGVKGLANGQWSEPLPIHDQNELGDLTRSFNQMAEEMTRQEQLRRQMVADIAHDLRTPLSVMALEVEAIRSGLQTPAESTSSLQEEIEWLQHLVDDLHTLSLMDADQIQLQLEPVALSGFLRSLFNHWQGMAAKDQRSLGLEIPAQLPTLCIDSHRMRQALGNLLNNALQHTPPDAQITLRAAQDDHSIKIQVIDSGPGIAPQNLPHIFERFYRADRSRKRNLSYQGSGLGLSIAHQLVGLHHGTLTVNSTPGQGATFTVTLPV